MKPIFRWVGGKGRLLGLIRSRFLPKQPPRRYFEPFLGGGALFFAWGHEATECFLSDICQPLMLAYEGLQESPDLVHGHIADLKSLDYYEIRDKFNNHKLSMFPDKPLSAALFIALNHMCFNGVYRENRHGGFNVPQGAKGPEKTKLSLSTLDWNELLKAAALLTDVQQTTSSFTDWPIHWPLPGRGDVKFYDPPYLAEYNQYNQKGFGVTEHRMLHAQAQVEADRGCLVIVCNSNNELTRSIFGAPTHVVQVNRTVGHSLRGSATEAIYVYKKA